MKRIYRYALFLLLAGLLLSSGPDERNRATGSSSKQKGMSYSAWWRGLYSHPDSDLSLKNIAATGVNWISLVVTCYQETISSTEIFPTVQTATDEDLIHAIDKAHDLGLRVMLKPHLDLRSDPSRWRGQIGTAFLSEAQWAAWFSSYRKFIEHYALLAQATGAEQFCAGTELIGTSHRAGDWRKVIAGVRASYSGPLVYAANHSGEETSITWWDAVDLIGVDTYYSLADKNNPTVQELKLSWAPHVTTLAQLSTTWQKPVIITEMGYRSIDGACRHPWDWQISGKVDVEEQADAYQAAFERLYTQPWLAGIFWWMWGTDPFEGGLGDDGYTPRGKPAEDVLRQWYEGPPRPRGPKSPEVDDMRTMDIYADGLCPGWEEWSWNADRNLAASDEVYRGHFSISVKLGPWGGLSFLRFPFVSSPYAYLEFYLRLSSGPQPDLWVFFYTADGEELASWNISDVLTINAKNLEPGRWEFVSIPIRDLGATGRKLARVSIQNRSDVSTPLFWVDEIYLTGAFRRGIPPSKKDRFR